MDDPVLATTSAKEAPVSTGGTGLTHDLVRLTRGDPGAARMLRDELLSPSPASQSPRPSASRPGLAAAPSGYSFRRRDLAVGLGVLATLALMVICSGPRPSRSGRSTVRPPANRWTAGCGPALGRADPRVVACGVLLPRLWGLLT